MIDVQLLFFAAPIATTLQSKGELLLENPLDQPYLILPIYPDIFCIQYNNIHIS